MKFEIEGFEELEAALFELKSATAKSATRRALIKAAQPTADAAAESAPVRSGALKDSIAVSTKLAKSQQREAGPAAPDETRVFVGPSYNLGDGGRHGHLLEFGTINMSAQPFMRPAWEMTKDGALKAVQDAMREEIAKSVARARRKRSRR